MKQAVNKLISAVKFSILQWVLMTRDFFLQPAGATPAGLSVECSFIALPHRLHLSEGRLRPSFIQSMECTEDRDISYSEYKTTGTLGNDCSYAAEKLARRVFTMATDGKIRQRVTEVTRCGAQSASRAGEPAAGQTGCSWDQLS